MRHMKQPTKILLSPIEMSENSAMERITPETGTVLGWEPGLSASQMRLSGLTVLPSCTLPYNLRSTKPWASGPERQAQRSSPCSSPDQTDGSLKSGEEIRTAAQEQTWKRHKTNSRYCLSHGQEKKDMRQPAEWGQRTWKTNGNRRETSSKGPLSPSYPFSLQTQRF